MPDHPTTPTLHPDDDRPPTPEEEERNTATMEAIDALGAELANALTACTRADFHGLRRLSHLYAIEYVEGTTADDIAAYLQIAQRSLRSAQAAHNAAAANYRPRPSEIARDLRRAATRLAPADPHQDSYLNGVRVGYLQAADAIDPQ